MQPVHRHIKDDRLSLVSQSWILAGFRSPPLQTLSLPGFCILRCGVSLCALSRDGLGSHGAAAGTTGCYETRAGLVKSLEISAGSSGASQSRRKQNEHFQQALHSCSLPELGGHTPVGITPTSLLLHSALQICALNLWDTRAVCILNPMALCKLLQGVRTRSSSAERNRLQQTHMGLCQLRI